MLSSVFNYGWWFIPLILIRLFAIVIHEYCHGYVSYKLGDPLPVLRGRLTFNPLAHLDFYGTILMLLTGIGWAKPVEVNPMYYKDRKKGMALVAIAGPLSNFILAFISLLLYMVIFVISSYVNMPYWIINIVGTACSYSAQINLCIMVFNLIPIPPLDGSKILGMFLDNSTYYKFMALERYSMFFMMFLLISDLLDGLIGGCVGFLYNGITRFLVSIVNLLLGWNLG